MKLIMGARSSISAMNGGAAGSPLTAALAAARAAKAEKDSDETRAPAAVAGPQEV
jgi:hypothetical protein